MDAQPMGMSNLPPTLLPKETAPSFRTDNKKDVEKWSTQIKVRQQRLS